MTPTRAEVLSILRDDAARLRSEFHVRSLALFGSFARDEAGETSDVDLLVEYDRPIGLLHHVGTAQHLERRLDVTKVDLVLRRAVLPELQDIIFSEAIDVLTPAEMERADQTHA